MKRWRTDYWRVNSNYGRPAALPSTSGSFSLCQTAQVDFSAWNTAAEGPQNYTEFPDHSGDYLGHAEHKDFPSSYEQSSRQGPPHVSEAFPQAWTTTASAVDSLVSGSVAMQRQSSLASVAGTSRSSKSQRASRAHAIRPSGSSSAKKKLSATRLASALPEGQGVSSVYMTGNSRMLAGDFVNSAQVSGATSYMPPSESMSCSGAVFPAVLPLADGLGFSEMLPAMPQHIDPLSTQMHLDYEGYLSSPNSMSSGSSISNSPPSLEEHHQWTPDFMTSPTETAMSPPEVDTR
jgi:hypothetical protein